MAFFPMTFPFYFDEVPAPVYPPFRPLADESLRSFGTIPEGSRTFFDPSFVHRPVEVEIVRSFAGSLDGRIFGVTAEDSRDFNAPSPSRVFGITPSASRPFDDELDEGRH